MYSETNSSGRFFLALLLFALVIPAVWAQDSTVAEIKYKEDYDRIQFIRRTTDPVKRAGQYLSFYKERPDTDVRLLSYADNLFAKDMEALTQQQNYTSLKDLCERALKIRPKFGEVFLFQGVVLKSQGKIDEAIEAFAKGYVIKNPLQAKAKQQLDITYRTKNKGSLIGEDKIVKQAVQSLK